MPQFVVSQQRRCSRLGQQCVFVIIAFFPFGYPGIRLPISCRDPFAKRLAAGITALVCGQAAINMAAAIGVAPLTGIPLPFVSYGRSNIVLTMFFTGILVNIGSVRERVVGGGATDPLSSR